MLDGKGKLVPTGKSAPSLDVHYKISHDVPETNALRGSAVSRKKTIVHIISCEDGRPVPLGEFDLVVGNEILRLKHAGKSEPQWFVLSSE